MTKLLLPVLAAVLLGLTTGCQHQQVYRIHHEPGELPPPPAAPSVPATRMPRVSVNAAPADAGAASISAALKNAAEGKLAERGFEIGSNQKPDRVVSLAVSKTEAASLAEWRAYEGKVVTRVEDGATGALLAGTTLSAKGERGLGEAKADENLAGRLASQLNGWLAKSLPSYQVALPQPPPPPPADIAVAMLTLAAVSPGLTQEQVLLAKRNFLYSVSSQPGILSCRLDGQDMLRRTFTFRVEYRAKQFPGGLLDTLILERPLGSGVKLEIAQ